MAVISIEEARRLAKPWAGYSEPKRAQLYQVKGTTADGLEITRLFCANDQPEACFAMQAEHPGVTKVKATALDNPSGITLHPAPCPTASNDPAANVEFVMTAYDLRYSREAMLAANADCEDICSWVRFAKPGDIYDDLHAERVECVLVADAGAPAGAPLLQPLPRDIEPHRDYTLSEFDRMHARGAL